MSEGTQERGNLGGAEKGMGVGQGGGMGVVLRETEVEGGEAKRKAGLSGRKEAEGSKKEQSLGEALAECGAGTAVKNRVRGRGEGKRKVNHWKTNPRNEKEGMVFLMQNTASKFHST